MSHIVFQTLTLEQVLPLRQEVLRPGLPVNSVVYPGDNDPRTQHEGALLDGKPVVVASIMREDCPLRPEVPGWRLHGVATRPAVRRRGYGAEVIRRCIEYARRQGGGLVWCNGRTAVRGFYEHLGFKAVGPEFEIPISGPHYVFVYVITTRG